MKNPKKVRVDRPVEFQDEIEAAAAADDAARVSPTGRPQPPPEEDLGGGDICSPEPSTDEDVPPNYFEGN